MLNAAGNACIACTLSNCTQCSSATTCTACSSPFVLLSTGLCGCPPTYVINSANTTCVCATNYSTYNNQCISCSLPYCQFCEQNQVCFTCLSSFSLTNGSCACPNTFVLGPLNTSCVCPSNTILNANGTACYSCNLSVIAYCITCQSNNFC